MIRLSDTAALVTNPLTREQRIVPLSPRAGSATPLPMGGSGSARLADSRLEAVFEERWSR